MSEPHIQKVAICSFFLLRSRHTKQKKVQKPPHSTGKQAAYNPILTKVGEGRQVYVASVYKHMRSLQSAKTLILKCESKFRL